MTIHLNFGRESELAEESTDEDINNSETLYTMHLNLCHLYIIL